MNVFKIYVLNITQNGEFPFIHILETKLKPTLDKSLVSKLDLLILVQLNIVHFLLLRLGLIFQNDLIDLKYLNEFRKNGDVFWNANVTRKITPTFLHSAISVVRHFKVVFL